MKKFAAILAATALVGVASVFAASPFSDVPTTSWAYQAVAQLASQGIINGYPNGTFQGQKNITRYEMAQMIAKAMVYQDRANAEQQATLAKLAQEFSAELNNMGVRIGNAESRLDNVKFTGTVKADWTKVAKVPGSTTSYEGDFTATAQVNPHAQAVVKLKAGKDLGGPGNLTVHVDKLYAMDKIGDVTLMGGRYNLDTADNGLTYSANIDGVGATATFGNSSLSVNHGYLVGFGVPAPRYYKVPALNKDKKLIMIDAAEVMELTEVPTATAVNFQTKLGDLSLGAFYMKINKHALSTQKTLYVMGDQKMTAVGMQAYGSQSWYGVGLGYDLGPAHLMAGFSKTKWNENNPWKAEYNAHRNTSWMAGVTFGQYDQAQAGTFSAGLVYARVGMNALLPAAGNDLPNATLQGGRGYVATVNYALANNLGLKLQSTFDFHNEAYHTWNNTYKAEVSYNF